MDPQGIGQMVSNTGLPAALLIYLVYRFDKFLTFLCKKLEIYNKEFGEITLGLKGIGKELKTMKKILTPKRKK